MLYHETIRVPEDRVGVIVGRNGKVRRRVEQLANVKIDVNSEGIVTITAPENTENPVLAWKARDMIRAMARGFSPNKALSLIDDDAQLLVISLREVVGSSQSQMKRVAGRIIGENGRTRRVIEQTTETKISVYGRTVGIIGSMDAIVKAKTAIEMLIEGASHTTVFNYLMTKKDYNKGFEL